MLAIYANIVYFHGFAYFCTPKVPVDSLEPVGGIKKIIY